ncbi:MAG: 50S ribosomal protein L18e [Nanoarchaeota archaeon]
MKRTGASNENLVQLIQELRKHAALSKAGLWSRIADDLCKPTRVRRAVNVSNLNRFTAANEIVVVPGKVLGSGAVDHVVTVAAFAFSDGARQRITDAKGKTLTIQELLKLHPQGKNVRIIG